MTRWKASAIHLGLSALVLGTIALVIVWRWYPPGLLHIARADTLLLLLAGVDLVMGPLLTLIVYKQGKKSLKFDLTVIALLQMAALAYGLNIVWESRPVYLVASDKRLTLLFATDIDAAKLAKARAPYARLPAFGPRTVAVTTPDALIDTIREMTGNDARKNPANFKDYREVATTLGRNARPVEDVRSGLSPDQVRALKRAIESSGRPPSALGLIPIRSSRGEAAMLLDRINGELLGPLAIALPREKPGTARQTRPPASPR